MPGLPSETVQKRISALEEAVRALQLNYTCVRTALEDAQLAVASLSVEEATRRAGLQSMESELAALRLNLARARSQEMLAGFPYELLRSIFLFAQDGISNIWAEDTHLWFCGDEGFPTEFPPECSYDVNNARLPFVLSAVNRRWRSVVLDIPDLWSFLCVPIVDDKNGAAALAYVQLGLSGSQDQGLDIVLAWRSPKWETSTYYRPILEAIGSQTPRWRRVSVSIPSDAPADVTQFLRTPMPRLENLTLAHNDYTYLHPTLAIPTYLPYCPQLRSLHNHFLAEHIFRQLPKLTILNAAMSVWRPSLFWTALKLLPALQHLNAYFPMISAENDVSLDEDDGAIAAGPGARQTLAHLRSLGLEGHYADFSAWFDKLDMPVLEHLRVCNVEGLGFMSGMLANVAPTVATVTIYRLRHGDAENLHNLAPLLNLKTLVLRDPMSIEPVLVRTLASREAARLPHLESIVFERGKLDSEQAAQLADLMHLLHAKPDGGITFTLRAKPEDVPGWLLRQYEYLWGKTNDASASSEPDGSNAVDSD